VVVAVEVVEVIGAAVVAVAVRVVVVKIVVVVVVKLEGVAAELVAEVVKSVLLREGESEKATRYHAISCSYSQTLIY
jgi:hypothetical protein